MPSRTAAKAIRGTQLDRGAKRLVGIECQVEAQVVGGPLFEAEMAADRRRRIGPVVPVGAAIGTETVFAQVRHPAAELGIKAALRYRRVGVPVQEDEVVEERRVGVGSRIDLLGIAERDVAVGAEVDIAAQGFYAQAELVVSAETGVVVIPITVEAKNAASGFI